MWKAGAPITIAATNTPQQLPGTVGLVKALRLVPQDGNTGKIYLGDETMDFGETPDEGIIDWAFPPDDTVDLITPRIEIKENDAPNGINVNQLRVAGTQNDVIFWAYLEQ